MDGKQEECSRYGERAVQGNWSESKLNRQEWTYTPRRDRTLSDRWSVICCSIRHLAWDRSRGCSLPLAMFPVPRILPMKLHQLRLPGQSLSLVDERFQAWDLLEILHRGGEPVGASEDYVQNPLPWRCAGCSLGWSHGARRTRLRYHHHPPWRWKSKTRRRRRTQKSVERRDDPPVWYRRGSWFVPL